MARADVDARDIGKISSDPAGDRKCVVEDERRVHSAQFRRDPIGILSRVSDEPARHRHRFGVCALQGIPGEEIDERAAGELDVSLELLIGEDRYRHALGGERRHDRAQPLKVRAIGHRENRNRTLGHASARYRGRGRRL